MAKNKLLANVPIDKVFWICDGRILKNIYELNDALQTMTDDTFYYHVNKEKNDFASWIRDVMGGRKLAAELAKARNRLDAAKKIKAVLEKSKSKKAMKKNKK
ncbi:MAG TPA: DUF5752 family protein [Candidatus Nanoarchaeia archaeon]|nr:DUF5752 family protein [Candidatus Nanoarchaeia archaeon]